MWQSHGTSTYTLYLLSCILLSPSTCVLRAHVGHTLNAARFLFRYTLPAARSGSEQTVSYPVPNGYTGYSNTGFHSGLFNFHGAPAPDRSASSMLGNQPDSGIQVMVRHHAFGPDSSEADAVYIPTAAAHHQAGFYANSHNMAWNKPITETSALPQPLPISALPSAAAADGAANLAKEAKFIMGTGFNHSQNLHDATAMVKSAASNVDQVLQFPVFRVSILFSKQIPFCIRMGVLC
jgi:hypothetical protein